VEDRISAIDDVIVSESMFGHGDAYWVNGKEIAHFEDEGVIEVRLTRAAIRDRRPAFKIDERVELRPSGADWITVRFATRGDVDFVAELVDVAAVAHRAPPCTAAKPPPTGAELKRRQQFH
jgi:predicted dehydrogenase